MTSTTSPKDFPWKRSRFGFAVFMFFSLLVSCTALRLALLIAFGRHESLTATSIAELFLIGFHQDFLVALATILPLLFWFWILPNSAFGRIWHRVLLVGGSFLFWTVQIFLYFVEFYFFDEFKSRFNTVAVDYLQYHTEVVGNIWESYPVVWIVAICCALSIAWLVVALIYFRQMWFQPVSRGARFLHFAIALFLCVALWLSLSPEAALLPRPGLDSIYNWIATRTQGTHHSSNRLLNEIANNGSISFVNAALTRNLDYNAFYRTLPADDAYARTRSLLAATNAQFVSDSHSIRRTIAGNPARPRLNVVILLEESLGSEFWGSLGRKGSSLTPQMDQLATQEGMFFTNIYACGNRTVRGFEGVLSSFPPLPGDSIVKRDRSENVESIARVLKRDGYETLFLYGGRGFFDNMRDYTVHNGWDRFIEQKDFPDPKFTTIWGVCDEEVFDRAIVEFRKLADTGKPFLGTIMSVSNHKPYTYPRGRITEDPDQPNRTREKAVKYSDWCLGRFFEKAKQEAFWKNTIFVVIADHGARVYGKQEIPISSYEIPWVILGPAVVKTPVQIGTLGNSLDVSPTILGLIGRPYESLFFGRDLLHDPPNEARALLNHNRDIGMFEHSAMIVLGLHKAAEYYTGDPKVAELKSVTTPTPPLIELEKNATAVYQVADDLYMHRLYRIDGLPAPTNHPPKSVSSAAVH